MIDSSRRHGHFDPRWPTRSSRPPRAPIPAPEDGGPSIKSWENEGGRYSTNDRTDAPAGLEWYAFSSRYFPGRRRHDLEALKAYEAYRSAATAPQSAPEGVLTRSFDAPRLPVRDPPESPRAGPRADRGNTPPLPLYGAGAPLR